MPEQAKLYTTAVASSHKDSLQIYIYYIVLYDILYCIIFCRSVLFTPASVDASQPASCSCLVKSIDTDCIWFDDLVKTTLGDKSAHSDNVAEGRRF